MKYFVDLYEFERKKTNEKLKALFECVAIKDVSKFLDIYRLLVFSIKDTSDEWAKLNEEIREVLIKNEDEAFFRLWSIHFETAEFLKKLQKKVYTSPEFSEANEINAEDQLSLILISTELITWYLQNKKFSNSNYNCNESFELNHALESIFNLKEHEQAILLYENIVKCSSDLIKYYYLRAKGNLSFIDGLKVFDSDSILKAINHHTCVDKIRFINEFTNEFKYSKLLMKYNEKDSSYKLFNEESNFTKSHYIYNLRNKTIQSQHELEFLKIENSMRHLVDPDTRNFPPKKCKTLEELFSFVGLSYNLFSLDLRDVQAIIDKMEIDVPSLLRAYTVLNKLSCEFVDNKKPWSIHQNSLNNTCISITYSELVILFVEAGIEESDCEELIELLTFNKDRDIIDCPLIKLDDSFIIIPSICGHTTTYLAVLSRVNEFKAQGELFENLLLEKLNKKNVKAISKKVNYQNEEFQCDLMFVLDEEIYICECKAWGEARSLRGYYEQFLKKKDAIVQLDRIVDFYVNNLNFIREDFAKNSNWCPSKVHRILIINNMIGDIDDIDGVRIIDFSYFDKFLKRDKPKIYINENFQRELKGFSMFQGNITRKRMNDFLYSDVSIRLSEARVSNIEEKINLFDHIINFNVCTDILPNYLIDTSTNKNDINDYINRIEKRGF